MARARREGIRGLTEVAASEASRLRVDDAVALAVRSRERMIRFANNSVTVVNNVDEAELMVCLAKEGRRAIASTSNPEESSLRAFVRELHSSLKGLPVMEFASLPRRATKLKKTHRRDAGVVEAGDELPELAKVAIDSATSKGAERSAGVVAASEVDYAICTSSGTKASDSRTSITLNIRSFRGSDASGHGLSCSASLSWFDPEGAGARAGEDAKSMVGARQPDAGKYEVILSPTVASNLTESVAGAASAFAVDAGTSYLAGKLGEPVASDSISITDHGFLRGALGGRSFDDEGMPTRTNSIVEGGTLKTYLHNLTTARRSKTRTTGNAGLISPHPWNIEVAAGVEPLDALTADVRKGILLTSNWYTRFKNYRTGEFSTVPRDGAYLIENGERKRPLKGIRLSDDLGRLFSSVVGISKERQWIQWWEVDTPTLCPWILTDGAGITRAYE